MNDERKEWLQKHIDHVFAECRGYIESKDNDCLNCLEGADTCYQVHEEMKRLIQQKPEIDEEVCGGEGGEKEMNSEKKMTIALIKKWIRNIKELAAENDEEEAHQEEDSLIESTLEAIAEGVKNPKELATATLKVKKIDFDRYYI